MSVQDQILTGIQDIQTQLEKIPPLTQIQRDVAELRDEMYGNGRQGMKAGLQEQKLFCAARIASLKNGIWQRVAPTLISTVGSAAIIGIILWALGVYKKVN